MYPTYRDYITALATRGGVIEAVPDVLLGSPLANLLIDPTGAVALLSTHEKIFVAPYRCVCVYVYVCVCVHACLHALV